MIESPAGIAFEPINLYLAGSTAYVLALRESAAESLVPGWRPPQGYSFRMFYRTDSGKCPYVVVVNLHLNHLAFVALRDRGHRTAQSDPELAGLLYKAAQGHLSVAGVHHLVAAVVASCLPRSSSLPVIEPRVHQAMRLLDLDSGLPFKVLAERLNTSPSHLSHLFKKQLGISFRKYVLWARTMGAWEAVVGRPGSSLTDIAHEFRFSDSAHLTRACRHFFGMTPSRIRSQLGWRIVGEPLAAGQRVPPTFGRSTLSWRELCRADIDAAASSPPCFAPSGPAQVFQGHRPVRAEDVAVLKA